MTAPTASRTSQGPGEDKLSSPAYLHQAVGSSHTDQIGTNEYNQGTLHFIRLVACDIRPWSALLVGQKIYRCFVTTACNLMLLDVTCKSMKWLVVTWNGHLTLRK